MERGQERPGRAKASEGGRLRDSEVVTYTTLKVAQRRRVGSTFSCQSKYEHISRTIWLISWKANIPWPADGERPGEAKGEGAKAGEGGKPEEGDREGAMEGEGGNGRWRQGAREGQEGRAKEGKGGQRREAERWRSRDVHDSQSRATSTGRRLAANPSMSTFHAPFG